MYRTGKAQDLKTYMRRMKSGDLFREAPSNTNPNKLLFTCAQAESPQQTCSITNFFQTTPNMERLSCEIGQRIATFLGHGERLSYSASGSRNWQHAIEIRTFNDLYCH